MYRYIYVFMPSPLVSDPLFAQLRLNLFNILFLDGFSGLLLDLEFSLDSISYLSPSVYS